MTVIRYLLAAMGGLSILGALLPGARVSPGRFSRAEGPPLARGARIALLVFRLACVALAMTCGRG